MQTNLSAPAVVANPYPLYAELRRHAPLIKANTGSFGDAWLVSRYDDVVTVLKDGRFCNDRRNASDGPDVTDRWYIPRLFKLLQKSMVMNDDADHRRLRNLVHLAFTPRMIAELDDVIVSIIDELLAAVVPGQPVDLVKAFALPLPLRVISQMIGVPEEDRHKFHHWSASFLEGAGSGPLQIVRQLPNGWRMTRFFERLIAQRRADPQDDLLTALVAAEQAGDRLSEDELMSMVFLLLLAGHETTVNLIGNGLLALLDHPDQMALLQARPELLDSAIEEMLRYDSPVQQPSPRFVRETFEWHGQTLRRGEMVVPILASANRDEAAFADADTFDITRHPNKHVGFGLGVHYCIGAPLARMEARRAFEALLTRFPQMQLAGDRADVQWRPTPALRSLKSLPLTLQAA